MYKVIFDSINSTQDEIIGFNNKKKILKNNNLYIQSFRQIKGTGRDKKKWLSPIGNIYLTINQKLKASYALRNNFYICYIIHKFFKINFNINLDYKWPNDLFFKNKKIVGVVVKSTILGKKSYLKTGIGININNSPIVNSVSLFSIINEKSNILDLSNTIINFVEHSLTKKISNKKLVRYLNKYMFRDFKLNHPIFGKNIIEILSVNEDLSLKIKIDDATKNIFFGELI